MEKYCVFCHKNRKLTKEHILPNWLSELYPKRLMINNQFVGGNNQEWPSRIFQHKAKIVCEECNGGWMSNLENRVKPIIIDLFKLKKKVINEQEQKILSLWAQKTVLMLNQGVPKGLKITPDLFKDIYKYKSPSKKVLVNLGWRLKRSGNKEEPIMSYQIRQILSIQVPKDLSKQVEKQKNNGGFIWKAIFTIGPIVYELIGHNMQIKLEIGIKTKVFKVIRPYKENILWPLEWPIEAEGGLEAIKSRE